MAPVSSRVKIEIVGVVITANGKVVICKVRDKNAL
jgi:hypothetical protein